MFGVGAALDGNAQDGLGLLDGDVQVAVVVGHDARAFVGRVAVLQPLHRLVPPDPAPLLQQRATFFLHVEASRQLMRQLLQCQRST